MLHYSITVQFPYVQRLSRDKITSLSTLSNDQWPEAVCASWNSFSSGSGLTLRWISLRLPRTSLSTQVRRKEKNSKSVLWSFWCEENATKITTSTRHLRNLSISTTKQAQDWNSNAPWQGKTVYNKPSRDHAVTIISCLPFTSRHSTKAFLFVFQNLKLQ